MIRKHHKLIITLITTLSTQTAISATDLSLSKNTYSILPCPLGLVVTLSGDVAWVNNVNGDSQTLNLAPGILKTYQPDHEGHWLAGGEIFLGVQAPLPKSLQGQLGLAFAIANDATLAGDIWDDGNPRFNNYGYRYEVNHKHLAVKGKLIGDFGCDFLPWVSAGLGVGYNTAHNFTNSPAISEAVTSPSFSGKKVRSFTYSVGAGVQYKLSNAWQAGLGYEFSDWGRTELGSARGQTHGTGLETNHLYTNSLGINLTYIG